MRAIALEQEIDLKPKISVIVPAYLGYDSVLAALEAWEGQTRRDQIEIIVLCPTKPDKVLFPDHVVVTTGSMMLHESRAAGLRVATADYVIFAEDHCLPDPDCIEAFLTRMEEDWDAVGPMLRSGDAKGLIVHASFLITYAQWMLQPSGRFTDLPGHNAVLRKQPLLDFGSDLERELIAPAFMMRRLKSEGARFFMDERARMRHFDVPRWGRSTEIFYAVGQGLGAARLGRASTFTRMLYALAIPLTAARHFARGVIHYARAGNRARFNALSLGPAAYFACVWAFGETVGALKGFARVAPVAWTGEIKPVTRERLAASEKTSALSRKS